MNVLRLVAVGLLAGTIGNGGAAQTTGTLVFAGADRNLPRLDENSGRGLKIECRPVEKQFVVGDPVNISCTVTNVSESTKPIGWHPSAGLHFCLVEGDEATLTGILPNAVPLLRKPILMNSRELMPGYVLYLPPRESMEFVLTYKPDRPAKFQGRVVYDPMAPRGGWIGPRKIDGLVSSNPFAYVVTEK